MMTIKLLTYWVRLWTTPELEPYVKVLAELDTIDKGDRIPWLRKIKTLCEPLKVEEVWFSSSQIIKSLLINLKEAYWDSMMKVALKDQNVGSITKKFLTHKCYPRFEFYLDRICPV